MRYFFDLLLAGRSWHNYIQTRRALLKSGHSTHGTSEYRNLESCHRYGKAVAAPKTRATTTAPLNPEDPGPHARFIFRYRTLGETVLPFLASILPSLRQTTGALYAPARPVTAFLDALNLSPEI